MHCVECPGPLSDSCWLLQPPGDGGDAVEWPSGGISLLWYSEYLWVPMVTVRILIIVSPDGKNPYCSAPDCAKVDGIC